MANPKKSPALLRKAQVARELDVSEETVTRLDDAGVLPPVLKAPGVRWWAARDIERIKAGVLADKEAA